jgi:hypothetical protein
MKIVRSIVLMAGAAALLLPRAAVNAAVEAPQHETHVSAASGGLVDAVRRGTEMFRDVRNAGPDYQPVLGCVSGPDAGAMGVHYLNGALLADARVEPSQPEALIYEFTNGAAKLVGVEFIILASVWHETHAPQDVPTVDGQLMQFYESPNRFGLPDFYELHVWAWKENPNGSFVDWHPNVSCDGVHD